MNNYQKERDIVFQNLTFSNKRKATILDKVTMKRKIIWQPIVALIAIASIGLLFIFANTSNNISQTSDHTTLEGYFDSIYSNDHEQDEKMQLLYKKEEILQENDAVLVSFYPSEKEVYYIHYLIYEDNEWTMKGSVGIHYTNSGANFNVINYDSKFIYVGPIKEELSNKTVFVGNKEAIVLKDKKIQSIWIQSANSYGTPVYYKNESQLARIIQYEDSLSYSSVMAASIPVLEANGDYSIIQNKSLSMIGANDDYLEYPLIIDHSYYKERKPSVGDVIMIESDGVPKIVRIKGIGPSDVTVTEGTILTNGFPMDSPYMIAAEEGNIHVDYTNMDDRKYFLLENQYFVQSDNWASDDFHEGVIAENEIIGVVAGYSLMHIEPNWSQDEINLYERYKKNLDDRLLKNMDAKTVFRLHKYAITLNDFKTAFSLMDKDSIGISYEKWAESMKANTKVASIIKRYIYEAHLVQKANENKTGSDIIFINPNTEKKIGMVRLANGVFKVKYEQVTDLSLN